MVHDSISMKRRIDGIERRSRVLGVTVAEAQALADADPAVRAGRLLAWVREWWVPAGRLP